MLKHVNENIWEPFQKLIVDKLAHPKAQEEETKEARNERTISQGAKCPVSSNPQVERKVPLWPTTSTTCPTLASCKWKLQ